MPTTPTTTASDSGELEAPPDSGQEAEITQQSAPSEGADGGNNVKRGANQEPAGVDSVPPRVPLVNSPKINASNRAERRREAEQDRVLVSKAQDGDKIAFRKLVERHQRRAFAIAIGLVRDENDARDIVQEAFLRVHRNLARFKGGSSFFTWLYRIVTNLSIDLMRKLSRREAELYENPQIADTADAFPFISRIDGANPIDVVRRREIATRIQQALDALPPYHRSVVLMREVEGMSYQEMAEAMQVSKGTIMSRLFHARQKLQRALADCYREQLGGEPSTRGNES